jgi:hypothetical protein
MRGDMFVRHIKEFPQHFGFSFKIFDRTAILEFLQSKDACFVLLLFCQDEHVQICELARSGKVATYSCEPMMTRLNLHLVYNF